MQTLKEWKDDTKQEIFAEMQREGIPGEIMSYDPQTYEGAKMHLQATLGEVPDLASMVNKTIKIANFLIHDASSADDSGAVETWKRIVIFDDNCNPYSCGSLGVAKSLSVMFSIWGMMPWKPPVECTVVIRRTAAKNNWMTLEPTQDEIKALQKRRPATQSK
jgi:hypothetical protein